MKSLQDAIYNWLSIKVVYEARPEDQAAKETFLLFDSMLTEDHKLSDIKVEKDEMMYVVSYVQENKVETKRFPRELIDIMINQIEEEPEKYPNFPLD